jgi:hypothetical protein
MTGKGNAAVPHPALNQAERMVEGAVIVEALRMRNDEAGSMPDVRKISAHAMASIDPTDTLATHAHP